jgi:DNA repair protein RadA/Sms
MPALKQKTFSLPRPTGTAMTSTLNHTLLETKLDRRPELTLPDELGFVRDAVSRFVAGGIYLIAGTPGGGKSLLSMQISLALARNRVRSLFVLTEQTASQLKEVAIRVTSDWEPKAVEQALACIQFEDGLYDVGLLPSLIARTVLNPNGAYFGAKLLIVDSVQGHGLASAATKSYSKVLEAARLCVENGITVLLVSHVTKRGDVAGPKMLEHGVDVTMVMRRAMNYTLLAVRKNRFGPPLLKPIPLVISPLSTRLGVAPHIKSMPGGAWTFAGGGLIQIQASVAVPDDGRRGRTTAPGLPRREIEQLVDTIAQIENVDLSDLDYRIQCRVPGSGRYQVHFGLPLCIALIGSFARRPIPDRAVFLGEVDLFRRILPLPSEMLAGLCAAIDNGELAMPVTLFVPTSATAQLPQSSDRVKIVGCRTLEDALFATWPSLR